jgi:xanthine phosphoribosyltransferase
MAKFRDDMKTVAVTWDQVHRDTKALVRRLLPMGPWRGIVALTRGGLVPAAIVAREMGIRVIDTLCVTAYDEQVREKVEVLKVPERAVPEGGRGWLLIDDLVDTGATAREARRVLPHAHFATLYAKPEGRPLVDTFIVEVDQNVWIFFPWDTEPQYVAPLHNHAK